jgi:hypothetical protein
MDLSPTSLPPNPAVWSGFFIVPSPAQPHQEMGFRPDRRQAYHGARHGWQQYLAALEQLLARID